MLGNTTYLGTVVRRAMIGMAIGTAVWLGLLLYGASLARQHASNSRNVQFGPLVLHTITLRRDASIVRAGITMEPGLVWYAGFWAAVGSEAGLIRLHTKRIRN